MAWHPLFIMILLLIIITINLRVSKTFNISFVFSSLFPLSSTWIPVSSSTHFISINMHFHKAILATVLAATSVQAAPLEPRDDAYFAPSAIWRYTVNDGAIAPATFGEISKATGNDGRDVTTLVTFTYPDSAKGKQCQLAFFLDETASLYGSRKIDVFSTLRPAVRATTGWGPGNQRNVHLGRLSAVRPGDATWDATYSARLTRKTPCGAANTTESFELVGVYDNDYVSWNPTVAGLNVAGPRIIIS
jgi:hypothetical protein